MHCTSSLSTHTDNIQSAFVSANRIPPPSFAVTKRQSSQSQCKYKPSVGTSKQLLISKSLSVKKQHWRRGGWDIKTIRPWPIYVQLGYFFVCARSTHPFGIEIYNRRFMYCIKGQPHHAEDGAC